MVQSDSLNELELGEYCRRTGIFPEQLAAWREACRQANASLPSKAERAEREEVTRLSRELQREDRDRALAEDSALLVLQKSPGDLGGGRGRSLPHEPRLAVSAAIAQTRAAGARLGPGCAAVGLTPRTLQR